MRQELLTGKAFIVVLALVMLAGSTGAADVELEGKMAKKRPFSFFLPTKWWNPFIFGLPRKRPRNEKELLFTKDGFALDAIQFRSRPINRPFDNTKKKLRQGMAPFEMAQVVIDDLELNRLMPGFKVLENKPVTVCGLPGFRIVYSYEDNGTLEYKSVYYGFQNQKTYYTIRYEAPAIHYFDTYLPTFEKMVRSASLIGRDAPEAGSKNEFSTEPEEGEDEADS